MFGNTYLEAKRIYLYLKTIHGNDAKIDHYLDTIINKQDGEAVLKKVRQLAASDNDFLRIDPTRASCLMPARVVIARNDKIIRKIKSALMRNEEKGIQVQF